VLEARTIHVADLEGVVAQFPRTRQMALKQGYRSAIFAPLLREGAALGTIAVFRHQPSSFSDQDVALLNTFADQAVIAIENVRLFNETQVSRHQQKAAAEDEYSRQEEQQRDDAPGRQEAHGSALQFRAQAESV
jgi:GAF domain-containing protein